MDKLALFGGPPMRATLLPYAHQTIEPDDLAAVTQALASDWITQGPTIARFERALAERADVKHAVAVANGTAALHAACWAVGLAPGDSLAKNHNNGANLYIDKRLPYGEQEAEEIGDEVIAREPRSALLLYALAAERTVRLTCGRRISP